MKMFTDPQVIEEYGSEDALAMVVKDSSGGYGVILELPSGKMIEIQAYTFEEAQTMAGGLI